MNCNLIGGNMKKLFLSTAVLLFSSVFIFSQSAVQFKAEAIKKDSVQDAVDYIKSNLEKAATPSDKRSLLYFAATLEEQTGNYKSAGNLYAQAAGMKAGDAEGMEKVSPEKLVLCAVRALLCAGDFENADLYLNSAVRSSTDKNILAHVNLYSVWSSLCKAKNVEETKDSIALLNAYALMDSMEDVRPQILFALWYLTSEEEFAAKISKDYPGSMEDLVIKGKVQLMNSPFWLFVPRF